jgi:hypothetical protein
MKGTPMKHSLRVAGLALAIVVAGTACDPVNPITWISNIIDHFAGKDQTQQQRQISCAVNIDDQHINSVGKTTFVPLDGYGSFFPQQWWAACFGAHPPGVTWRNAVPTTKASGAQNDWSLPLAAQCITFGPPTGAFQRFDCAFDSSQLWVVNTPSAKVFMQVASA